MSVSTPLLPTAPSATRRASRTTGSLWRTTVIAGVVGAAVTTAAAALLLHAAGVSFEFDGEAIPLLGYAQMTLIGAVIGGVLLAALNRWSQAPRRRFVEIAVVLTALSCVPSVAMPDDTASKVALVALHVLAAAIIVPMFARRAADA